MEIANNQIVLRTYLSIIYRIDIQSISKHVKIIKWRNFFPGWTYVFWTIIAEKYSKDMLTSELFDSSNDFCCHY